MTRYEILEFSSCFTWVIRPEESEKALPPGWSFGGRIFLDTRTANSESFGRQFMCLKKIKMRGRKGTEGE